MGRVIGDSVVLARPSTSDTICFRWLKIEKKKRKGLAKAKHPAKAVADEAEAATRQKSTGNIGYLSVNYPS